MTVIVDESSAEDWACHVCGYNREEHGPLAKPMFCPVCEGRGKKVLTAFLTERLKGSKAHLPFRFRSWDFFGHRARIKELETEIERKEAAFQKCYSTLRAAVLLKSDLSRDWLGAMADEARQLYLGEITPEKNTVMWKQGDTPR